MSELLLELSVEEIPALMQERARTSYHEIFERNLKAIGLDGFILESHIGPRRIAFFVGDLPKSLASQKTELKGPKTNAPPAAIEGFCKSNNISKSDLVIREVKGQECYFYEKESGKIDLAEILPQIITSTISEYIWPKSMYWGNYDIKFVRPLFNILCLLDGKLLSLTYGHLKSSDYTYGHRFEQYKQIKVKNIDDYKQAIKKAHVILSREERLDLIRSSISKIESEKNIKVDMPQRLLEEVAGLNEHIRGFVGKISDKFMHLPPEILTTSMKSHQRFFSCRDASENFAPYFVFVSNVVYADSDEVIHGNEKVLSARLADALYFYNQDQKIKLEDRISGLDKLVFHKELGSMKAKVERLSKLANFLKPSDKDLEKAAYLCKSDLVTEIVGEFPELQGIMGYYYARGEKLGDRVAAYIGDHYKPVGLGDLPGKDSLELALIDKVDSLVGLMLAGERATGSKDPYGLRRHALGVVRILLEGVDISLIDLIKQSASLFKAASESKISEIADFVQDRLKNYWKDEYNNDLVNAVVDFKREDNLILLQKKIIALKNFVSKNDAGELLSIYRRISNITSEENADLLQADLLRLNAEKTLYNKYLEIEPVINKHIKNNEFEDIFDIILSLKGPLSNFFDNVLVNDADPKISSNRKTLLVKIYNLFQGIANFSSLSNL